MSSEIDLQPWSINMEGIENGEFGARNLFLRFTYTRASRDAHTFLPYLTDFSARAVVARSIASSYDMGTGREWGSNRSRSDFASFRRLASARHSSWRLRLPSTSRSSSWAV